MRRILCLLVVSSLFGVAAEAQSKADAYVGYVYTRQTYGNGLGNFNMNGGIGQIAVYPSSWLGFVGEFGGSAVRNINGAPASGALYSFMAGPRISFRHGPLQPYVQGLFGGAHLDSTLQTRLGATSANGFAAAAGGGLDLKLSSHAAVRLGQVDYFLTRLDNPSNVRFNQNNFRYSAGFVFRF